MTSRTPRGHLPKAPQLQRCHPGIQVGPLGLWGGQPAPPAGPGPWDAPDVPCSGRAGPAHTPAVFARENFKVPPLALLRGTLASSAARPLYKDSNTRPGHLCPSAPRPLSPHLPALSASLHPDVPEGDLQTALGLVVLCLP